MARAHLARVDLRTEVRLESCDQEREVVLAGERCARGVVTLGVRRVDERGRVHLLEGVTRTSQRWDTGMCRAGREEERAAAKKAVGA